MPQFTEQWARGGRSRYCGSKPVGSRYEPESDPSHFKRSHAPEVRGRARAEWPGPRRGPGQASFSAEVTGPSSVSGHTRSPSVLSPIPFVKRPDTWQVCKRPGLAQRAAHWEDGPRVGLARERDPHRVPRRLRGCARLLRGLRFSRGVVQCTNTRSAGTWRVPGCGCGGAEEGVSQDVSEVSSGQEQRRRRRREVCVDSQCVSGSGFFLLSRMRGHDRLDDRCSPTTRSGGSTICTARPA